MVCPNMQCHNRNADDLCLDLYKQCRSYIKYEYKQVMEKESQAEAEMIRQISTLIKRDNLGALERSV
jgi:hypothetical protein